MKENKYLIECRYEVNTNHGKEWTSWFIYDIEQLTEEECKEKIKSIKNEFGHIDKKTKLKHEYRIIEYSEYEKQYKDILKQIEKQNKKYEEYIKSDKYKDLKKKIRKDRLDTKKRYESKMEE